MDELIFFCVIKICGKLYLMVEDGGNKRYLLPSMLQEKGKVIPTDDIVNDIEGRSGCKIKTHEENGKTMKVVYNLDREKEKTNKEHLLIMFENQESYEKNIFKSINDVALRICLEQRKDFAEFMTIFISNQNFRTEYPEVIAIVESYDLEQSV